MSTNSKKNLQAALLAQEMANSVTGKNLRIGHEAPMVLKELPEHDTKYYHGRYLGQ
jgi:hypothetical protein